MEKELEILRKRIDVAREHAGKVFAARALFAGTLAGAPGMVGSEVEFPDPDLLHVYRTMFGHRVDDNPLIFRLSFGSELKWVGVSHPWGLKLADVIVPENGLIHGGEEEEDAQS